MAAIRLNLMTTSNAAARLRRSLFGNWNLTLVGYDYSNHHVFVADNDAGAIRDAVIDSIRSLSAAHADGSEDADRSFVVGPPARWIFVGDTAGSTESADPQAFECFAMDLSRIAPTVNIKMSDSAVVHILLYAAGRPIDKFGNGTPPCLRFKSLDEAKPFRGNVSAWSSFLLPHVKVDDLRRAWNQDNDVEGIIQATSRLFGIHPELIQVGYSIFDEGDEIKYDDWIDDETLESGPFDEFHLILHE